MVSEAEWEEQMLDELSFHGWLPREGKDVAPGTDDGRESWDDIVLPGRALTALRKLNPTVPGEYLIQALRPSSFSEHTIESFLIPRSIASLSVVRTRPSLWPS